MLNSILLVICVCIVVVLIFFLFYWNRCIAYILASLFRFSFWNQGDSSIWLDIGELIHFSCSYHLYLTKEQNLFNSLSLEEGYYLKIYGTTRAIRPSLSSKASSVGDIGFVPLLRKPTSLALVA